VSQTEIPSQFSSRNKRPNVRQTFVKLCRRNSMTCFLLNLSCVLA